eukprot:TRINITY_DN75070_c0_g1_i1.p1 TRINITY_DN75070_c0_g1~~TRINITY_DN75070_c0_g1_i1.p1  ORF type:complete len:364 (+),score=56.07 TRINITY_DN75070_c0_g1_i1:48-1139(+)
MASVAERGSVAAPAQPVAQQPSRVSRMTAPASMGLRRLQSCAERSGQTPDQEHLQSVASTPEQSSRVARMSLPVNINLKPACTRRLTAPPLLAQPASSSDFKLGEAESSDEFRLGEIVLLCIQAAGVELASFPPQLKTIVFKPHALPFTASIGRQQQPGFFERLVPNHDVHSQISRCHFELQVHPPTEDALVLSLRSPSPGIQLWADCQHVAQQGVHSVAMAHESVLSLARPGGDAFLSFRVVLRSQAEVLAEGPHAVPPSFACGGEVNPCSLCKHSGRVVSASAAGAAMPAVQPDVFAELPPPPPAVDMRVRRCTRARLVPNSLGLPPVQEECVRRPVECSPEQQFRERRPTIITSPEKFGA